MKSLARIALAALALVASGATASTPAPAAAPAANPEAAGLSNDEKAAYALGFALWRNLQTFDLTPAELELVKRALTDAAAGTPPLVTVEEARPLVDAMRKSRLERKLGAEKSTGQAFAAQAAAEPGAVTTPSGLVYRETAAGTGPSPKPTDRVRVHYRGTLVDGTEFDSSFKRNQPAEFALTQVVKCWTEGLQKMKVGGKAVFVCPSELAYGDRGRPSIPPGATLRFEVELLAIVEPPAGFEESKPESE